MLILSPRSPAYVPLSSLTEPGKIAYSERWGLRTWFPDYPDAASDRGFGRLDFMARALHRADDGLVWVLGADALVTNLDKDVREFITPETDIVACWDDNGLQSDSMLLRASREMFDVLTNAYRRIREPQTGDAIADSDQGALISVLSGQPYRQGIPVEECQRRLRVVRADKTLNRHVGDWQPGDLIFHPSGCTFSEKIRLLKEKAEGITAA